MALIIPAGHIWFPLILSGCAHQCTFLKQSSHTILCINSAAVSESQRSRLGRLCSLFSHETPGLLLLCFDLQLPSSQYTSSHCRLLNLGGWVVLCGLKVAQHYRDLLSSHERTSRAIHSCLGRENFPTPPDIPLPCVVASLVHCVRIGVKSTPRFRLRVTRTLWLLSSTYKTTDFVEPRLYPMCAVILFLLFRLHLLHTPQILSFSHSLPASSLAFVGWNGDPPATSVQSF